MSGECNWCGGPHAEGGCNADRELIYENGRAHGDMEARNNLAEQSSAVEKHELQRAYSRGYNAASRHWWPDHVPIPPNKLIAQLMNATNAMVGAVECELGTIDADDPWQEKLGNPCGEAAAAVLEIGKWLKSQTQTLGVTP